jgi:hypothetical protein
MILLVEEVFGEDVVFARRLLLVAHPSPLRLVQSGRRSSSTD